MKIEYFKNLKEIKEQQTNKLFVDVIDYYLKSDNGHLYEVVDYGCSSGCVGHLIYYHDTVQYYNKFKDEIWDLLEEERENQGYNNIIEFIYSWETREYIGRDEEFKNYLTWWAFETISYNILSEMQIEEIDL